MTYHYTLSSGQKISIMSWPEVKQRLRTLAKTCQSNRENDIKTLSQIIQRYDNDHTLTNKGKLEGCERELINLFDRITDSTRLGVHTGAGSRLAKDLYHTLQDCFFSVTTQKLSFLVTHKSRPTSIFNPQISLLNIVLRINASKKNYVSKLKEAKTFPQQEIVDCLTDAYSQEDTGSSFGRLAMTLFAQGLASRNDTPLSRFGENEIYDKQVVSSIIAKF